ncbi:MAG: PTS sugar transporter subunit IIA [Pseudomonadota bacterium]
MKLTLQETAKLLDLPTGMVERWIRQGRIPIRKSGEHCYFEETVLEKWAATHNLAFSKKEDELQEADIKKPVSLRSAMENGGVFHGVPGKNAEEIFEKIISRYDFLNETNKELLLQRLMERESLTSTGIGNGIAIPHPRSPLNEAIKQPAISTCFLENPIDFKALDGKPVFVLFLMISTSIQTHLHLLSRLSFCLRDPAFVSFLASLPDKNRLLEKIALFDRIDNQ